jgi:hypothetical protein
MVKVARKKINDDKYFDAEGVHVKFRENSNFYLQLSDLNLYLYNHTWNKIYHFRSLMTLLFGIVVAG